ncbi:MAG: hypothetical protein WCI37_02145, partial [bacterium]
IITTKSLYHNLEAYYQYQDSKNKIHKPLSAYANTVKNTIIENNAYVSEAKISNVDYSQSAVNNFMKQYYVRDGSQQKYYLYVLHQYGETVQVADYINQTNYLKSVLDSKLFTKNLLFGVVIRWDPYIPDTTSIDNKIKSVLTNQFLPLFNSGASDETIKQQTDYYKLANKIETQPSGPPSTYAYMKNIVDQQTNDQRYNNVGGGGISNYQAIKNLTHPGQNTGVYKASSGYYGIFRLEQSSAGKYSNEQAMINNYSKKAVYFTSYTDILKNFKSVITKPFAYLFGKKVFALSNQSCFNDGLHLYKVQAQFIDSGSGQPVNPIWSTITQNYQGNGTTSFSYAGYNSSPGCWDFDQNGINMALNTITANDNSFGTISISGATSSGSTAEAAVSTFTGGGSGTVLIFGVNCLVGGDGKVLVITPPSGYKLDTTKSITATDSVVPGITSYGAPSSETSATIPRAVLLNSGDNGANGTLSIPVIAATVDNFVPTVSGTASCGTSDINSIKGFDKDIDWTFVRGALPVTLSVDGVQKATNLLYNSSFSMSSFDQTVSHTVTLKVTDYNSNVTSPGTYGDISLNITYPPCYSVVCYSPSASAVLGVSSSIFASVQFSPINGAGSPPPSNIGGAVITSMTIGQTGSFPATIASSTPTSTGTGSASFSFTIPGTWSPGSFSISFSYSGAGVISCTGSGTVTSQPYFSVNGGDVVAGSNLNTLNNCSALNTGANAKNAGILGFNTGSLTLPLGAGTTLAAQALGQISGFNTNTAITTSTTPYPLDALAFANYTNLGTPTQSTKLGGFGDAPCSPVISAPTTISTASTISATPSSSTTYNVPLLKINFSSTVGNKTTIYVNGDVYIKNNINFGTFTLLDQIPSLNIVANSGNIYIDPSVTSLEGTYMAIRGSSGTGGAIYDCSTDSLAGKYPPTPAIGNNPCYNNLTINGSFIAHDVYLQRTTGNAASPTSGAAEQFNYGPEQWLSSPTSTSSSIETIQSLPPVF